MPPKIGKIRFETGNTAHAVHVPTYADALETAKALNLRYPAPTLFLSGGASNMDENAMRNARALIEDGVARFAAQYKVTVIDGGTDAGIMKMMGEARRKWGYRFPLVGCAPMGKVTFPGLKAEDATERTPLEANHSHFVLVDADHWGAESEMIVGMARELTAAHMPTCGVLINGGKIAQYDIYIASARGDKPMPVIAIEGSGRTANLIASASKTGMTSTGEVRGAMLKAIIQGGNIEVVSLTAGPQALYSKLRTAYQQGNTHRTQQPPRTSG